MPQLVAGVSREQIEEAIKAFKLGGIMTYYSSYVGTSKEKIEAVLQAGSFETKGEGVPKQLLAFLKEQLEQMQ